MSECDVYRAVADSLARQAHRELAEKRLEDARRPIGEKRLDIDFYSEAERDKPISDGEMTLHGAHYSWKGARWCVVRVVWTGREWKRYRRISGPLNGSSEALTLLVQECKRLGLERVP